MNRSRTKPGNEDVLARRLGDDQGKILILAEVSVKERELLMAMGRIVRGVQIERDRGGQRAAVFELQSLDAGGDGEVDQLLQNRRRGQVLKPAERGLAGQRLVLRQAARDQLENRIITQGVVIVAVLVAGQNAEK